jgi:hypothetical protein
MSILVCTHKMITQSILVDKIYFFHYLNKILDFSFVWKTYLFILRIFICTTEIYQNMRLFHISLNNETSLVFIVLIAI